MDVKILIVDDEESILNALQRSLASLASNITCATNGAEALEKMKIDTPDILITDLRMPVMGGIELLNKTSAAYPSIQTIVITGHGTIDDAVAAMKKGAYDFITKPFKKQQIYSVIKRASENILLQKENKLLKEKLRNKNTKNFNWGKSRVFTDLLGRCVQAAQSEANLLLLGESGTGKEVIVDYIHSHSHRSDMPIIKVNCAAIPDGLLESELFGHVKGAFTGAVETTKGKFAQADKGTIFLDEIAEIPIALQAKLLRVLQNKELSPIGGKATSIDVRIIAATNQDLRKRVEQGLFREDLYYRLNVIPLIIPPLRERSEDIPSFISFFIKKFCAKNKRENLSVSAEALNLIERYGWPGNVRELENALERAVILCRGHQIVPEDLPPEISTNTKDPLSLNLNGKKTLEDMVVHIINTTLKKNHGDKSKTADDLGISLRTIYRKIDNA